MALVSKAFGDIITFTRASTGTYFDATGTLQSAAIDAPRFDYDPATLAARGFLIEEARTNSIRNNTMQGAVAGTPGLNPTNWAITNVLNGLTKEIVGTGITNGITWIDVRWSGTATATGATVAQPENILAVTAATGQSWSASAWWAIVGGSTANITAVNQRVAGRSVVGSLLEQTDTTVTLTATLTRYAVSRTMTNASTERVTNDIAFSYNNGAAIDITLRIGLPQLELGAFATSVIPTTTTALTRSADVASVNTLSPWYRADEGTLFAEFSSFSGQLRSLVHLTDGTVNNRIQFFSNAGVPYTIGSRITSSGATSSPANTGSIALNAIGKAAITYAVGNAEISVNGGTPATASPAATPIGINVLGLGAAVVSGTPTMAGHLRRVTYYPRALSSAELQTITA